MRIRSHLILMAAAVLLPVSLAAGIALQKVRDGERDAALRGLRETVRATALIVDREVQGSLSALKALGNSEHLETRNFKAFYAQAAALNQPPDVWTLLVDNKGLQVINTVAPFGTPPPRPAQPERIIQAIADGKTLVTDLVTGPATNKLLTAVYSPAAAAGGKAYGVAQAFSVEHWRKIAVQSGLPADWVVAVIDREGRFIARSHRSSDLLGQKAPPELVAAAAAAPDGLIRHQTLEGIEAYDAFAHSSLSGWTIAVAAPVKSVEAAAGHALLLAVGGLALAVAAAIVAAAAFGRRFIRAIEDASHAAIALGHGEMPRITPTQLDEVNELNHALVEAGTLLAAERGSRHSAEAERERLLESEMSARASAQAQNVAKDQFLAMLGHELRNPLAAISGATSLLEMGGVDKVRSDRYLEIIRRQNRHLGHIVNDLLDVSRLMAGKIVLDSHPLNLSECVNSCVEALRATDRAIGYRISVRTSPVWVSGDAVRLDQILNNLITNALNFSHPGSEVKVEVHHDVEQAVVSVQDSGAGIPPELLPRVFEPFVQGPPPGNRTITGLGIGLALVKQLVELHGGVVHATSAGPGRGSTFTFWIPSIPVPVPSAAPQAEAPGSARTVVYVEDNADARETMSELLRAFGYEVVEVADGLTAVPTVLSVQPDAVLLDIGLPDIDGYEVARRLRSDPATKAVPIIALTGYGQMRDKEAAMQAGFDSHLVKPVDPVQMMKALEELLAAREPST